MAQDAFKHISVNRPDEEDEVITAGIAVNDDAPAGEPVAATADVAGTAEVVSQNPQMSEPRESADASAAPSRAKSNGYSPATLDDLKGEPMSLTQKIVIIAAVVCIIGAIAYYFAFMR